MKAAVIEWGPYLILILVGFLPNEVWRVVGLLTARRLDEDSELVIWSRTVATALLAGVILGFVNAIVRPVLFFLTLPLTLLTLGLFIFVLNAICFALTAWLVPGFSVDGFFSALVGALLVSVVSWILNGLVVGRRERD